MSDTETGRTEVDPIVDDKYVRQQISEYLFPIFMAVAKHARAGRAVEDFMPHFEKKLPLPAWLKLPPKQFQTVSSDVNTRINQLLEQTLDKWEDELLALHMTALNEAQADADASAKRIELEFTAHVPPLMEKYRLAIADTSVSDPDIVEFEKIVFKKNLERGITYLRITKNVRKDKGYNGMVKSAYQHINMLDFLPHSLQPKPKPAPTAAPDETAAAATTAGATVEETGAEAIAAAAAGATTAAAAHPQHSSKQTPPRSSKPGNSTPNKALLPIQTIKTIGRLVNSELLSPEEIAWLDPPEPATAAAATPAAAGRSSAPTPSAQTRTHKSAAAGVTPSSKATPSASTHSHIPDNQPPPPPYHQRPAAAAAATATAHDPRFVAEICAQAAAAACAAAAAQAAAACAAALSSIQNRPPPPPPRSPPPPKRQRYEDQQQQQYYHPRGNYYNDQPQQQQQQQQQHFSGRPPPARHHNSPAPSRGGGYGNRERGRQSSWGYNDRNGRSNNGY